MRKAIVSTLSLAAVSALAACGDPLSSADATNAEAVARGEHIYAVECASCHGKDLKGEPDWRGTKADGTLPAPPHDDSGHTWHHADSLLFEYTKFGGQAVSPPDFRSAMPAFKDKLSDDEIWAVLSFIKSRWSLQAQQRQARLNK